MNELPISYYKAQHDKLLNQNQELKDKIAYLEKRIGGRKSANISKYKRMRRLSIKQAWKIIGKWGMCQFHTSNKTDERIADIFSKLFPNIN